MTSSNAVTERVSAGVRTGATSLTFTPRGPYSAAHDLVKNDSGRFDVP